MTHSFLNVLSGLKNETNDSNANTKTSTGSGFQFAVPKMILEQYDYFKKGHFWNELAINSQLQSLNNEIEKIKNYVSEQKDLINPNVPTTESEISRSQEIQNEAEQFTNTEGNITIILEKGSKAPQIKDSNQLKHIEIHNFQKEKAKPNLEEKKTEEITSSTEKKEELRIRMQTKLNKLGLSEITNYLEFLNEDNKTMIRELKEDNTTMKKELEKNTSELSKTNNKLTKIMVSLQTIAESMTSCVSNLDARIDLLGLYFYAIMLRKCLSQLLIHLASKHHINWENEKKTKLLYTSSVKQKGNQLKANEGTQEVNQIYALKNEANSIIHNNALDTIDKNKVMPDLKGMCVSDFYRSKNRAFNSIYGNVLIDLTKEDPENLNDRITLQINQHK